jgi:hypothetical protein
MDSPLPGPAARRRINLIGATNRPTGPSAADQGVRPIGVNLEAATPLAAATYCGGGNRVSNILWPKCFKLTLIGVRPSCQDHVRPDLFDRRAPRQFPHSCASHSYGANGLTRTNKSISPDRRQYCDNRQFHRPATNQASGRPRFPDNAVFLPLSEMPSLAHTVCSAKMGAHVAVRPQVSRNQISRAAIHNLMYTQYLTSAKIKRPEAAHGLTARGSRLGKEEH